MKKLTLLNIILIFILCFQLLYAEYTPEYLKNVDSLPDYRKNFSYNGNKTIKKPVAQFRVRNNNTSIIKDSYSGMDCKKPFPILDAVVGDTLSFYDLSLASNSNLKSWDFQYYGAEGSSSNIYSKNPLNGLNIKLTKVGTTTFYLAVMSDAEVTNEILPWSENGNHQTIGPKTAQAPNGIFWYFTAITVKTVETPATPKVIPTPTPMSTPTPRNIDIPTSLSGGEIKVSIVKEDGIDKLSYHPQWKVDTFRTKFSEAGHTFGQLFDLGMVDRKSYPALNFNNKINWTLLDTSINNAKKFKVIVSYEWQQTTHQEWKVIGSHTETRDTGTVVVNDYGWVSVNNPKPVANVNMTCTSSGKVIKSIKYNIASGADAKITYVDKNQTDSNSFSIQAGEKKEFSFSLPSYSNLMNGKSFSDNNNGNAKISVTLNATIQDKTCPDCNKTVSYIKPDSVNAQKNISVDATKVFPHDLHLTVN